MDQQKEPQVNLEQTGEALRSAKERLSGQAESLSLKEYMVKHPYIALGTAFLAGTLMGGSGEIRESVVKAATEVISKEVIHHEKKKR
ncbi:MAG: hypothetical protein FWH28_00350 [Clostridiales bacterium]|nr:hypothetical protein [Clostridiales bacterium]